MTKATKAHPWWCGHAHYCTANRGGQHRSAPLTARDSRGSVVVFTRTRTASGRNGIEFRTTVALPDDETTAHQHAKRLARRILTATTNR